VSTAESSDYRRWDQTTPVSIAASVRDAVYAAATDAAPDECCGLLLADRDRVVLAWPATNLAPSPRVRYEVDPRDHFAALRHARAAGLTVIGAFHSHPRTAPEPSPSDRDAAHANFLYVIAGRELDAPWSLRAFVLRSGNFVERRIVFEA
jgi:proteasome lid subunit RPN8/RPN11